jgi:hypothetical protein
MSYSCREEGHDVSTIACRTRPVDKAPPRVGERAVLKLMFGALIRAAGRWRSIKVTEFEHRQIAAVRKELGQEYETQIGLKMQLSKDAAPAGEIIGSTSLYGA